MMGNVVQGDESGTGDWEWSGGEGVQEGRNAALLQCQIEERRGCDARVVVGGRKRGLLGK